MKLSILNSQQQDLIHNASLDVLKTVGCEIQDKRWLDELSQHDGVVVDQKKSRVFITDENIINSAIESCGRKIKALARDPQRDWELGKGDPKAQNPEGITHLIDLANRNHRETRLADIADISKICDYLSNVDAIVGPVVPYDIPPVLHGVMVIKTLIENTSKPIRPGGIALGKTFPFVKRMLLDILGGRDVKEYSLGIGVTATSPLVFPFDQLDAFWQGTELETVCDVGSMPQAGSTSPASLGGTLTLFTAETLMGIVMGQLKRPGLAQFVYVRTCISNPRYGIFNSGPVEVGLLQAAATQLIKEKYRVLVNSGWGVSDSHDITPQTSYEKAYIWMTSIFSGADMVSGVGGLGSGLISSPAQLIIDNEILGYIKHSSHGIIIDDFHLGVEMIEDIGIGGSFLFHPQTSKIIRDEWRISDLPIRDSYDLWTSAGSPDFREKAEEEAKEILETHIVEPMDPDLQEKLDKGIQEAKKKLT
ncbi:MAG: trimethylamine methyltransferase family protein [Candidatus Hodarchaeales archaeon]